MEIVNITTDDAQAQARDQYQTLHDLITHAREVCNDSAQRTMLRQQAEDIQDILTALDRSDLQAQTAAFEAVAKQVSAVNVDLQVLKAEIGTIVEDVVIATKVVGAIDAALSAAAKLFG
jgi:hypothetical protein